LGLADPPVLGVLLTVYRIEKLKKWPRFNNQEPSESRDNFRKTNKSSNFVLIPKHNAHGLVRLNCY
jgi:hypothetical protein